MAVIGEEVKLNLSIFCTCKGPIRKAIQNKFVHTVGNNTQPLMYNLTLTEIGRVFVLKCDNVTPNFI
jgi:hypothetical protein